MAVTDPPVPTVTPVTFDSSFVYGRQHMNQNFTITRARDFEMTGYVTRGASAESLTGATITLTAKWDIDGDVVFQCSSPSDGITITSPSTGAFTLLISASKTSSLPLDKEIFLPYECRLTTSANRSYPILYGKITVRPNIV